MARVLTAAHVSVMPAHQKEYLAVITQLAARLKLRGQHLWLFRRRQGDAEFLEFTEGKDDGTHRRSGPADAVEAELEARLLVLAKYDATRQECWDEVPLIST